MIILQAYEQKPAISSSDDSDEDGQKRSVCYDAMSELAKVLALLLGAIAKLRDDLAVSLFANEKLHQEKGGTINQFCRGSTQIGLE